MISTEENYRALLDKLIRFREETAELRASMKLSIESSELRPNQRESLRAKVKVLGAQLSRIDFMLARNRREIDRFGLQWPATGISALASAIKERARFTAAVRPEVKP